MCDIFSQRCLISVEIRTPEMSSGFGVIEYTAKMTLSTFNRCQIKRCKFWEKYRGFQWLFSLICIDYSVLNHP